jgi:undecaprenyl-diphosphatase
MPDLSYLQAIVLGALQGVTELFPVSSLGHSVLVPALIGGAWKHLVTEGASANSAGSPYLSFVVALHVATALALVVFYRKDWVRIVAAFVSSIRARRIDTPTERLAWLLVVATIPVGLIGLALEKPFRTLFATPMAAAAFLTVNGLILFAGERLRKAAEERSDPASSTGEGAETQSAGQAHRAPVMGGLMGVMVSEQRQLDTLEFKESFVIGLFQTLALLAGISRSGITMVAGLLRGLDHEDAAKFSFLLATPVILAAGVLKVPSLAGPAAANIHGQVLVGAVTAGVAAYLSVRFLTRYFTTRTLIPFAIYSLVAGIGCLLWFGLAG